MKKQKKILNEYEIIIEAKRRFKEDNSLHPLPTWEDYIDFVREEQKPDYISMNELIKMVAKQKPEQKNIFISVPENIFKQLPVKAQILLKQYFAKNR